MPVEKYRRNIPKGNEVPVIVDGARSAFVKSFGVFERCDTLELFSRTLDGLSRRINLNPEDVDEVVCGVVVPQVKNGNVGRDAILNLEWPAHIHGYTVNRQCTSSLQSIADASHSIKYGNPHLILAGGVECLSDVPIVYSEDARRFLLKLNKSKSTPSKLNVLKEFTASAWIPKPPSISEPLTGLTMGQSAEVMAKFNKIGREEQDKFAVDSHMKAHRAQEEGVFNDEIVPIWPAPKFNNCVDKDNIVRGDTTVEKLSGLRPAFDKKYGTLTAGNSSSLTDGASVTLVGDEKQVKEFGYTPKAYIRDAVFIGVNPHEQLLIGPAIAIPKLLKRNGFGFKDIDFYEIHEAFAAQVLSCIRSMEDEEFNQDYFGESAMGEFPMDRLNVNGGALALGHPFGATGSRLVNTLTNQLHRTEKSLGVVGICAAGGIAGAMLIERYDG